MYRKEFAFSLKSPQSLPEQISEIDDTTRLNNMSCVQQVDRMQQPWQILQHSAQQESQMFDISPVHLISEQLSSGSSDISITDYQNRMIDLDSEDLSSLLIPLHYSTEPLEDVPRLVTYAGSDITKTSIDNSTQSRKKRRRKRPMGFRRPKVRKKRATSNPTDSLSQQKKI
ncbi:hypothetical protein TNIN_92371 [Trichonephila inaurata madagascariensis]|uniref:Uncharacterized protein n=1 Tax=Trichonephila inaurata madagascariensis TaxID=2747483 RepID=A0A8X7CBB0_9ARAC|nr:hypothetical protein TNIN_92371 [Trichonephila inaurata madagascariensis]